MKRTTFIVVENSYEKYNRGRRGPMTEKLIALVAVISFAVWAVSLIVDNVCTVIVKNRGDDD